jgi:tRNA(Ile)-lysidine synthase
MIRVSRRERVVASVVRAWRELTGGGRRRDADRRTLVACSGGADSSALAIALAAAAPRLVIAHVLHDLRPRAEAARDREAASRLAAGLGVQFVEAEVRIAGLPGNAEANARRARYAALARLALERECPFVATAHHGDDVLEGMLMALARGAGARGLSSLPPRRDLVPGRVALIRPMLGVTRADAEHVCALASWEFAHDATNADIVRARAAVRHGAAALMRELRPGVARRAVRSASLLRDAADIIAGRARDALGRAGKEEGSLRWDRRALAAETAAVVGEAVRLGARQLAGARGQDRLGLGAIDACVRAIRDDRADPRRFVLARVEVRVLPGDVVMRRRDAHG